MTAGLAIRLSCSLVLAGCANLGCANVIGLENEYYQSPELTGRGGSSADGGAGAPARPTCDDHPIPPRSNWKIAASSEDLQNGGLAPKAIDGTTARWSTGKPQSGDEWLQLDFGRAVALRRVNLQQGANENDYPREYAVHVSNIDKDLAGARVSMGAGIPAVSTPILLPQVEIGRYLLIQQLGGAVSWWSVVELEVSCTDEP